MRDILFKYKILTVFLLFEVLGNLQGKAQTSDAVFTNTQTFIVVKNNKLNITYSLELKINNKKGEQYAETLIPYSKMRKIFDIKACIKDKNGIVVKKLKSQDIVEQSNIADFSLYEDNFEKKFTLLHNEYPYTLCYSYQMSQEDFFYIDSWSPVIYKNVPTLNAALDLNVPLNYKIAFRSQFVDKYRTDTIDNQIHYHWESSYNRLIGSEVYSPCLSNSISCVEIVPIVFKYDKIGSLVDWISYGNWEYSLIEGLNDLPETEKHKIDILIDGINSDLEKVKVLYHYLQDETRYINISIKTGGMKPYPASYVATNKYGDCKALSNYFKSILDYIGIKSFYTNVYADENRNIKKDFPSMQFNHVILCVPLQKDTVWLDCTSNGPFNYLGTFTQNREVLLIDKDNSHFAHTPSLLKNNVLESRSISLNSDSSYVTIANFHIKYRGEKFEELLALSHSVTETDKALIVRNNLIESTMDLIDYKLIPVNRDSTYIIFDYSAKTDGLLKRYGNELLLGVVPFSVPAFKDPKLRKCPIQLDYPIFKIDTLNYNIPVGYKIITLGQNKNIITDFGMYSIIFKAENTSVKIVKSLLLFSGKYPLNRYPDFYKFISDIAEIENHTYIVTSK